MKLENHSASAFPNFDFPARTEEFAGRVDFNIPESENPFFVIAPETPLSGDSKRPDLSAFPELPPLGNSTRRFSLRLLSFAMKVSLLCLLAAIGWYGYQEYTSNTGKRTIAGLRNSQPSAPVHFVQIQKTPTSNLQAEEKAHLPALAIPSEAIEKVPTDKSENLSLDFTTSPADSALAMRKKNEEIDLRHRLRNDVLDPDLILALADNLTAQKRKDEAWLLLAKSTRTGDKRFASRILSLGLETNKHDESLMIIEPEAALAPEWENADWITIALLHEKSGNTKHALELLKVHDKKKEHTRRIIAQ